MHGIEATLPFAQLVIEVDVSVEATERLTGELIDFECLERVQECPRQELDTRGLELLPTPAVQIIVQRFAGIEFAFDAIQPGSERDAAAK